MTLGSGLPTTLPTDRLQMSVGTVGTVGPKRALRRQPSAPPGPRLADFQPSLPSGPVTVVRHYDRSLLSSVRLSGVHLPAATHAHLDRGSNAPAPDSARKGKQRPPTRTHENPPVHRLPAVQVIEISPAPLWRQGGGHENHYSLSAE